MPEPEQAKHNTIVNTDGKMGWPDVVYGLSQTVISKNLILPVGALAFLLLMTYKMNSPDIRDLLEVIINRKWFACTGWILFIITVMVSIKLVKWQRKTAREHIQQMTMLIDELKKVKNSSGGERQLNLSSSK